MKLQGASNNFNVNTFRYHLTQHVMSEIKIDMELKKFFYTFSGSEQFHVSRIIHSAKEEGVMNSCYFTNDVAYQNVFQNINDNKAAIITDDDVNMEVEKPDNMYMDGSNILNIDKAREERNMEVDGENLAPLKFYGIFAKPNIYNDAPLKFYGIFPKPRIWQ